MQVQDNVAGLVMENMSNIYFLQKERDIFDLFVPGKISWAQSQRRYSPGSPDPAAVSKVPGRQTHHATWPRAAAQGHTPQDSLLPSFS